MTGRAVNGSPMAYTVNDLNQVTSVGGVPCTYDQNGNRLTYGQGSGTTTYEYDDENRLTRVTTRNGSPLRSDFTYDGLGRLRVRTEYSWYYNQWSLASTTRYIYDGKRVIQERNGSSTPLVTYTRGKDLSGSLQGAGGIGGLLARSHGYSGGTWSTHSFYHADALGNITYMIDSAQAMVASYKYDPYGRTISSSGSLAAANLYRFSSKEFHANSGFYYYLYRFYDPNTQRWMNRDPLSELGSFNLYRLARNYPTMGVDAFGLAAGSGPPPPRGGGRGSGTSWPPQPLDPTEPGGEGPCEHESSEGFELDWYRMEPMAYGFGRMGAECGDKVGSLINWLTQPPPLTFPLPGSPLPEDGCSLCPINAPPSNVPGPVVPPPIPPIPSPPVGTGCRVNRPSPPVIILE